MKLAVSSYGFARAVSARRYSYLELCDLARDMGYQGIEFIELESPIFQDERDPLVIAGELREHCEAIGLDIVAYTVSADLLSEDQVAEVERLKRQLGVAQTLGAGIFRHDVCHAPRAAFHYNYESAISEVADAVRSIADYAASLGIRSCTENHGRFMQDPERVEALIRHVNHPNFGWLVDMGNFLSVDADVPHAVSIAAPYVFHVHVKDNLVKPASGSCPDGWRTSLEGNYLRSTIVGNGQVPVEQCLGILQRAGYDGYVSVEFEGWEENIPALESSWRYLSTVLERLES